MNTTTIYDSTLNDDMAHPHVAAARREGRAWAEGEADAAREQLENDARNGKRVDWADWCSTDADARPLWFERDPLSDEDVEDEAIYELAEIKNEAARERWDEIGEDFEERLCELRQIAAAASAGFEHPLDAGYRSAPLAWDRYRDADPTELRDAVSELRESLRNDGARFDADALARIEDEIEAHEEAIVALARGERVRVARDEDGAWFARSAST